MPFSSVVFIFYFLPLFLAAYYLLPGKNLVLLAASLVFYGWGEPRFLPLLLAVIGLNYLFGRAIGASDGRRASLLLAAGVAADLGLLGVFKYLNFFVAEWDWLALQAGLPALPAPGIALPLGNSFFTFQGLSYLFDIRAGLIPAQKGLVEFATYKAMFPQLIAGPIVRYREIAAELPERRIDASRVALGIEYFVAGLSQKVLLADTLALPADHIFSVPAGQLPVGTAWLGALCYMLQIYFDFGGYSNMAIGLAHMIGFSFPRNFDRPYASASVSEFWRRWHMTLSAWFRDYLYIPLGGNRVPPLRLYANLLTVFFLCGLWHGASLNFIVWGLYHGAFLIAERAGLSRLLDGLWRPLRHLYLWLAVMVGWVFFRAASLADALDFLRAMAGVGQGDPIAVPLERYLSPSVVAALAIGLFLSVWPLPRLETLQQLPTLRPVWRAASVLLFLCCAFSLAGGVYNPFLYFRF